MREAVPVPTYLNPCLYVEGNEPGSAVEGVPTSIAAFIGFTQIGPFDTPRFVTTWSQFVATFGDFTELSYLPRAVYGYFENGGSACYVVRVGAETAVAATDPETLLASRALEPSDFVGSGVEGTGLASLEALDEVSMACAPDVMMALQQSWFDIEAALFVKRAMVAHSELKRDRLTILDPPPDFDADQILRWRSETATFDSAYATLYWPWIEAVPSNRAHSFVPPSGHVAGIWARSDETKGVHKAPAKCPSSQVSAEPARHQLPACLSDPRPRCVGCAYPLFRLAVALHQRPQVHQLLGAVDLRRNALDCGQTRRCCLARRAT